MQTNSYTPVYLFALNLAGPEQERYTLDNILGEHSYGLATGSWEGVEEKSYLVTADKVNAAKEELRKLWADTDQDAVLFLDNQRSAYLYTREDGYEFGPNTQHLGTFREVSETIAKDLPGWTRIGNTYFAAR